MKWPIEPYEVQVQLSKAIHKLIVDCEEKKVGVFESPTGTGKTLSTLVGTLQAMSDLAKVNHTPVFEPDWIKAAKSRQISSESDSDSDHFTARKRRLLSKVAEADEAHMLDDYSSDVEFNVNCENKVRLIYCSRTHSQLAQVAKEFSNTCYSKLFKMQMLASRKYLCLNTKVTSSYNGNVQQLNDKCSELCKATEDENRCPFYSKQAASSDSNVLDNFSKELLQQVRDIEDIVKLGKRHKLCAYFGSKRGIVEADILLIPYNLLILREARESLGINLKNSIVVFDEAHNIGDCISQAHSTSITATQFNEINAAVVKYFERFRTRLSGKNSLYLQQIMRILRELCLYASKKAKEGVIMLNEFIYSLQIDNINLYKVLAFVKKSKLAFKILSYCEGAQGEKSTLSIHNIYNFLQFLGSLALPERAGKLFIVVEPFTKEEITFKFLVLNPSFLMQELVECGCSKILLLGGTMKPFEDVKIQLFPFLTPEQITFFSGEHVVSKDNLFCAPIGRKLNFSFQTRSSLSTIDECGNTLLQLAGVVPNGLVVFFTCYAYLQQVIQRWKATTTYANLQAKKSIFLEEKDSIKDAPKFLAEYSIWAKEKRGAILLSVVGGRLSEGINFSDELARAVVVVGMPFPNVNDPEMRERIAQYNQVGGCDSSLVENICMKSVNQAIGRAIRHANDYAAILLMDSRFETKKVQKKLPEWIQKSLFEGETDVVKELEVFFAAKSKTLQKDSNSQ
jgi:chromosome transmission fidelity protein 1